MNVTQFSMSLYASEEDRREAMLDAIKALTAENARLRKSAELAAQYHASELADVTAERDRLREELVRWKRRHEDLVDELTISRGLMGDT